MPARCIEGWGATNRAAMGLYNHRFALADEHYPGGDGYVARTLHGPIEQGITMGLTHHLTGDPACVTMFRDVMLCYASLVHERHDGEWCFEHITGPRYGRRGPGLARR